jgi:hypothetical protein
VTTKVRLTGLAKPAKPKEKTVVPKVQHGARETPVHRFVAQLRERDGVDYKTIAEVAAELKVSHQWVRKIQRQGLLDVPSKITYLGKIRVYLYTPADVEKVRRYLIERQAVYVNRRESKVESWEDVKNRRERAAKESPEDSPVVGNGKSQQTGRTTVRVVSAASGD